MLEVTVVLAPEQCRLLAHLLRAHPDTTIEFCKSLKTTEELCNCNAEILAGCFDVAVAEPDAVHCFNK